MDTCIAVNYYHENKETSSYSEVVLDLKRLYPERFNATDNVLNAERLKKWIKRHKYDGSGLELEKLKDEIDLCGKLNQEWWDNASVAANGNKMEMQKKYLIYENEDPNISDLNCSIKPHNKAHKLMQILTDWLINENHVFHELQSLRLCQN